jgi:integrase
VFGAVPAVSDTWSRHLPPHWKLNLAKHGPKRHQSRARLAPTDNAHLAAHMDHLYQRLGASKAPSTWRDLAQVLNQFTRFDQEAQCAGWNTTPLELKMALWVEAKVQAGHLHGGSPVEYVKKLQNAYRVITGGPSLVLADLARAYRRNPEFQPVQAKPLSRETWLQVLDRATTPAIYLHFLLMWKTASRASDMPRLKPSDFAFRSNDGGPAGVHQLLVTWSDGVKGRATAFADIVLLSTDERAALTKHLRLFGPEESPFHMDDQEVTQTLRRLSNDPALSSHSVKRGALQHLLLQGFSVESVSYRAKHQSVDLLRVYVGSEIWAEAHGALGMAAAM